MSKRNPTRGVRVGSVTLGNGHPVAVQSMCATHTQDVDATVEQAEAILAAGGALVRVAVDSPRDVEGLVEVRRQTEGQPGGGSPGELPPGGEGGAPRRQGPLQPRPPLAPREGAPGPGQGGLSRRAWPGSTTCAIRIGVNCGSVDPAVKERHPDDDVQAMVESALEHCGFMDELGFERYVVSLKDSHPRKVIEANRRFAEARPEVPLHLGVTEAGMPPEGIIKTRVAFEQLLSRGIGDTLRVSLTLPNPRKHEEITVGQQILDDIAAGRFRSVPVFDDDTLNIISCPSCSRVENEKFVELAQQVKEMTAYAQSHALTIAVMGCRVNGPGETDDADLGLWCGPTHVNLKRQTKTLGAFDYDEILPRLKEELDALIAAQSDGAAGGSGK